MRAAPFLLRGAKAQPAKEKQMAILKNKKAEAEAEADAIGPRTGPNVDNGYVDGVVTVDPLTGPGRAAAAARDAHGAKTTEHDDGTVEVTDTVFGDVSDNEIEAVLQTNPSPPSDKADDNAKAKAVKK
jgi:hypothetical protein